DRSPLARSRGRHGQTVLPKARQERADHRFRNSRKAYLQGQSSSLPLQLPLGSRRDRPALARLVRRDPLSTATVERMVAGGRTVEIVRMKITDAGRQALAGRAK